jgi:outer membrane protein assembly factor BamB
MRFVLLGLLCVATLGGVLDVSHALAETNWPQFRGPHGDGQSSAKGLPLTWSETENIRWKTPIHGKGWSSPVVWNDQIWLTTATEDGKQRFVVCVDAGSGRKLHDVVVLNDPDPQYCHPMNSYASPTPVIEAGRVYLHFGSAGTLCLDTQSAKTLWARRDLLCDHHRGAASSPILFENLLIVPYDGVDQQYIVAFDKQTGKTVWKRDRKITSYKSDDGDVKKAYGTCTVIQVAGKPHLISPSAEATIAYDPRTGDELWRVRHGGMNASARPLFSDGRLILNTGAGGSKLLAVDPAGRGDITDSNIIWKYGKAVPTRSSQLVLGDLLFMVNDSGIASCVDAREAKQDWQERFGGDYSASPIYVDGRIYFFSEDGRTPVIEPSATYKLLAENKLGDGFMASPAVVDKAFILRTRSHVYRVENP